MLRNLLLTLSFSIIYFIASSQTLHVQANFNDSLLPTGWSHQLSAGSTTWGFGLDGAKGNNGTVTAGNNNIDGTALAYFDDDILGPSSADGAVLLVTNSFDNSTEQITLLDFDYNFKEVPGGVADSFYVEVYNGSSWIRVFSTGLDDCGHYTSPAHCGLGFPHTSIDISAYKNPNCQVRFAYFDDGDWGWYVGLDNVIVQSPLDNDVAINFIEPINNNCSSSDSLTVEIENKGANAIFGFPIGYRLNNGTVVSSTFTDTLSFSEKTLFTFPNTVNYNLGTNTLEVFTQLNIDQNLNNDTSKLNYTAPQKYNLTYNENFESANHNWTISGTNSSWQIGIPAGANINTASSGLNAAVTNLSGDYNASETSYLTSPCIFLGPSTNEIRLNFDLFLQTETFFDRLWVEHSIDGGINWTKTLLNQGFFSNNWYNNSSLGHWDGFNQNWQNTSTVISGLPNNTTIKFRFVFITDGSSQLEGVGIDNFSVYEVPNVDLSVAQILNPTNNSICGLVNSSIVLQLENWGSVAVNSAILNYQIDNGPIFTDTLFNPILSGSTATFIFSQSYDFTNVSAATIKAWCRTIGDTIPFNDTLSSQITNTTSGNYSLPYFQDFDNMALGGAPSEGWTRGPSIVNTGWLLSNGGTPSTATGPNSDATGGNFFFLETSTNYTNDPYLESPCIVFEPNSSPALYFAYHMYGSDMGTLFIDIFDGNQWIESLDSIRGQQHGSGTAPWTYRRVDLSIFSGRAIKVRFRGRKTAGNGFRSDMAIDNIRIFEDSIKMTLSDISIDSIHCGTSYDPAINIGLINYSNSTIPKDSVWLDLYLNGQLVVSENPNIDIFPLNTIYRNNNTFSFRPPNSIPGLKNIRVIMRARYLSINTSDTVEIDFQTTVDQYPYYQGFENLYDFCFNGIGLLPRGLREDEGWYQLSQNNPQWAVLDTNICSLYMLPNYGPSFPFEGSSYIYLDRGATQFATSYLHSPCFDLGSTNLELEYYVSRFTSDSLSIGDLILEIDSMGSWVEIDRVDTVIFNNPNTPWTQVPWVRSVVDLSAYSGQIVNFRFHREIPAPGLSGMAIDAFRIYDPLTVSESSLNSPNQSLTLYPNPNNGTFSVEVPENLIGEQYQIIDLSGKTVKRANFNSNQEFLNLDAEKGIYLLSVPAKGIREKVVVY